LPRYARNDEIHELIRVSLKPVLFLSVFFSVGSVAIMSAIISLEQF